MSTFLVFCGRPLSLFFGRFGTVQLVSAPIKSISYEASGSGGILHVNDLALSLNSLNPLLPSLEIGTTKGDQVALSLRLRPNGVGQLIALRHIAIEASSRS